jgi:class 3 adenylate cyclase/CHASE2 domain-containing sensor protein
VKLRSFPAAAFLAIGVGAIAAQSSDWMALANGKLLDASFALWRSVAPEPTVRDVTVIGIDVEDLRKYDDPRDFWHAHYGRLLVALAKAKPAVVGLDVVLPQRSYQQLIPGLDQALLKGLIAVRGETPVVFARTVDDFKNFREIFAPYVAMVGPDSVGTVIVCKDEDDIIRRFDEYLCDPSRTRAVPSLAGIMAQRLGIKGSWRGWIDYRIGAPIQYLPFREVVRWADTDERRLRSELGGKPVLLGFILPFEDRKTVPVDLALWEPGNRSVPGVLVHAQVLRTLLNGGLVQPLANGLVYALAVLGAALVFPPSGRRVTALYALYLGLLAAGTLLALRAGWFLQSAGPALAATFAVSGRFMSDAIAQARERATLRGAFAGYVSPQIMDEILAGRIRPGLIGKRERVCVLFSDIRDFTSRSEFMAPEALIEMLNRYFSEMTQCVHQAGGTVDKFLGDGMMCFFGAPQPLARPASAAVAAARDMLARLERLNADFKAQGLEPIAVGIGLHVGEAIVGHVGSDDRNEYTAIGDAVNTASRIEELTKKLGHALLISKNVFEELEQRENFTPLGEHPVRGRSSVQLYGYTGNSEGG